MKRGRSFFPCTHCKDTFHCSTRCQDDDWEMGHKEGYSNTLPCFDPAEQLFRETGQKLIRVLDVKRHFTVARTARFLIGRVGTKRNASSYI